MLLSFFCLWNVKKLDLQNNGKNRTTFLTEWRLIECSQPGWNFPRARFHLSATQTPHHNVRPPQYRGPSLLVGCSF
jgi:hypothetical protein